MKQSKKVTQVPDFEIIDEYFVKIKILELRNYVTCGVKKVHRARVQIAFSTNLSRLQLGPFSKKQKDFLLL